jgi:sulfoxide reductase catalytic subunit YedY
MARRTNIRASEITSESNYLDRRRFLQVAGLALAARVAPANAAAQRELETVQGPYSTAEAPNSWEDITTYNNFYEFGTSKEDPYEYARDFVTTPWSLKVSGECAQTGNVHI